MSQKNLTRLQQSAALACSLLVFLSSAWNLPGNAQELTQDPAASSAKSKKSKRQVSATLHKREMAEADMSPVIQEIFRLKWEEAPGYGQADDVRKISLEKVFHETLEHSIPVRQAEVQIEAAETQARQIRMPGLFNLLNPIDIGALKQAGEAHVRAAQAHLQAVRQKELLASARMHGDLIRTFMNKYLAFQAIEQGKLQLRTDQQRFISGEINSFDVSQTQMALIDRYEKYLQADNLYHTASLSLSGQLAEDPEDALVPEGILLQDGNADVALLGVVSPDVSLETVVKASRERPELRELEHRRAALERLVKAASGLDKDKKEAELRQLELEMEKAQGGAVMMAEKAYSDYKLAAKNLDLARQRHELANRYVRQLQVSHEAGFSSSKDVMDGQIELARIKTALVGSQVAYNLAQIQLVYEMGLLTPEITGKNFSLR